MLWPCHYVLIFLGQQLPLQHLFTSVELRGPAEAGVVHRKKGRNSGTVVTKLKQRDGHMSHIPFQSISQKTLELTYLPWTLRFKTTFRNWYKYMYKYGCHSIDGCHYKVTINTRRLSISLSFCFVAMKWHTCYPACTLRCTKAKIGHVLVVIACVSA